ncbi:MAG: (2Fe-2S)-binding protein [Methanobacteriota archaeon]
MEDAIDEGFTTITELKGRLRLGMGPCQGRGCLALTRRVLCKKLGLTPQEIMLPKTRPPSVPVSLGTLASEDE